MRTSFLAATAAAVAAWSALPAAGARAATFVAGANCVEHQAFVDGDPAAVGARLPRHYTPVTDAKTSKPLVFARALRCDRATVDGRTGPLTLASIGVVIESPDGTGCGSGLPGVGGPAGSQPPLCNWYTLYWLSTNRRMVEWLRRGTPGVRAVYSPHLVFSDAASFHFSAPGRYTIDDVAHPRPGQISVRGGYWTDTHRGTVKVALSTDDLTAGDASGTVRAPAHSEMAMLMGATARAYATAYAGFAAVRIGHGSYRKQLLWPSRNTNSFAGSCSLQGEVGFDPAATNTQQNLSSRYDAAGDCSGRLNGRSVRNAHVIMRESGPAYASCIRAQTTAPWIGNLTFADGTMIPYTLDFTSAATEVTGTAYGNRSGYGDLHATFATSRTPPDVPAQCAAGGLRQAPMDLSLTTTSPIVSNRPRLHLAVRPRVVPTGRRTTFVFSAIHGSLIRFAGKRTRTGRGGHATVTATLRRRGAWAATATRPGYVRARTTVRAVDTG